MRKLIVLMFMLYLLFEAPIVLNAQAKIEAGFPPSSIWLSQSSVIEGKRVDIGTVVFNASKETLKGTVTFLVDGNVIGTRDFEISAGSSQIILQGWTAQPGPHTLSARITDASGKDAGRIALSHERAGELAISVASAPPPTALQEGVQVVANKITEISTAAGPAVVATARTVFNATEDFRQETLAQAKENVAKREAKKPPKNELSALRSQTASSQIASAVKQKEDAAQESFLSRISQLAAPAIVFAFGSPVIFYVLLCALLLAIIYILSRFIRRPSSF